MSERIARVQTSWDKYADTTPDEPTSPVSQIGSLVQFETDTARYHFHPGNHTRTTELPGDVLECIDAIVIEETFSRYESYTLDDTSELPQYEEILRHSFDDDDMDVYLLDLPSEFDELEKDHRYFTWQIRILQVVMPSIALTLALIGWLVHPMLGGLTFAVAILPAVLVWLVFFEDLLFERDVLTDHLYRLQAVLILGLFYTETAGRSAMVAQKLDRFVAPKLATEMGEKPDILIDYGKFHLDMVSYLKRPHLRRAVLRWFGWRGYKSRDRAYVDQIMEFRIGDIRRMARNESTAFEVDYKKVIYELDGDRGF